MQLVICHFTKLALSAKKAHFEELVQTFNKLLENRDNK